MTKTLTVQPQNFDYYNFYVIQNYVFNEPAAVIKNSCTYEENGVLYCASATEKGVYCYSYCLNNPLMYTDPSGQSYRDVFDDYGINRRGEISLLRPTTDDFDRLYALDRNGKETNKFITVAKGLSDLKGIAVNGILEQLESTGKSGKYSISYALGGENFQDAMLKVFKFAADNSKVEWRVDRYSEDGSTYYSIGVNHNTPDKAITPEMIGLLSVNSVAFIHSHWGVSRNRELSSMGFHTKDGRPFYNRDTDVDYKTNEIAYKNVLYYTYFPESGNVWSVRNNKIPAFIRNVNNYKGFFWGTLNTW